MVRKNVTLFHPWIKSKGGAEKIILEIMEKSIHNVVLYTWVYDMKNTFEEFQNKDVRVVPIPFSKKLARKNIARGFLFPLGILKKIPLKKSDLFLISTSGIAEFVALRNNLKGRTIAYVHTPLREANKKIIKWNLENKYKGKIFHRLLYVLATKIYQVFEKIAWKKIDFAIFNSELSKSRAKEHRLLKNKKSRIIYPPLNLSQGIGKNEEKYFVYWSRLNPPKRQDLLIKAWNSFSRNHNDYKLFIVGTPDNKAYFEKLKYLAKQSNNVILKTNVSNSKLKEIVSRSSAGIFLGYFEDFGMVPLEVLASKKPLIAVNKGGYMDLIGNHPEFYKIEEMHEPKRMVQEIEKALDNFVRRKRNKRNFPKIEKGNFIEELDELLSAWGVV